MGVEGFGNKANGFGAGIVGPGVEFILQEYKGGGLQGTQRREALSMKT